MFYIDLVHLLYAAILIAIGLFVLMIRRKANGGKSLYKIILILIGIILSGYFSTSGKILNPYFIKDISVLLLIILMFELSMRMTPENIGLKREEIMLFAWIVLVNSVIVTSVLTIYMGFSPIHSLVFSILLSSIEYFMIDSLKREGDLANPLLLLFGFSILFFYELHDSLIFNVSNFIQYILIGLGMGVAIGIVIFKSMRYQLIKPFHEIGLLAASILTYICTVNLGGSGLFSVMILGVFFGNSYIKKKGHMNSFSPFIFKSLEAMIYLMVGFSMRFFLSYKSLVYGAIIIVLYYLLRFAVIHANFLNYSLRNKLFLSLAPKGMTYAAAMLVLAAYDSFSGELLTMMLMMLIFSLAVGIVVEYIEGQKEGRLERFYKAWKSIKYGRNRKMAIGRRTDKTRR
jgi:hypothetical protein